MYHGIRVQGATGANVMLVAELMKVEAGLPVCCIGPHPLAKHVHDAPST